ncbi:AbrB/MazE/SpoVT family DNA-binding domain-containing protein [Nocardia sp. NPDC058640]|uniref:AbrB/MazE/SpoVT family DNA-binding domain-containing protein n=1 Tax=Nocardia sp. NPDC058640 TaxID=3346571 RepID=UPI003666A40C
MDASITVTSKGQTTLPVAMRRRLGLADTGGTLHAHLDEETGHLVLSRPPSLREINKRFSRYIKSGTPPLQNVDEYYQSERG